MVTPTNFNELNQYSVDNEGLVLLGCGGDLNEWVNGISEIVESEGIGNLNIQETFSVTTSGGRIDLLLPLKDAKIDMGKLAIWRLNFGDCSWLSDYVVNYRKQHNWVL